MKLILNSYTLSELRKMISSKNIKKYSKLIKSELIELMIKSNKFNDVKMKEKKEPTKKVVIKKVAPKPKRKLKKSATAESNRTGYISPIKEEPIKEEVKKERKIREVKVKTKKEIFEEIEAINKEVDDLINVMKSNNSASSRRTFDTLISKRKRLEKQL